MTKHIMDCWEAQELLEGIDFGAIDADDALALEAQRHHAQCADCRTAMDDRLTWNARLTEAMSAVTVPADLESRLANRLGPLSTAATAVAAPRSPRRGWRLAMAAVAALLLIAVFLMPWRQSELLTQASIIENIGCELTDLKPYDSTRWKPELPMSWRSFFRLQPELTHAFPPGRAMSTAALVPFEFRASAAATPIRGRLIMVPVSQFQSAPNEGDFLSTRVDYFPGFYVCVWREGDWVYLCYVRSVRGGELDELQRLMRDSHNFT